MKVLQFTLPVPREKNIIAQKEVLPFFYQHLHRHDELQLTWILRGEGTLVVNNNMHPFRSGEMYCIGANQPHVFKSDPSYFVNPGEKSVEAITVFFNPNGKLQQLFELEELKPIKSFLQKHRCGFAVPEYCTETIGGLMEDMLDASGTERFLQLIELLKNFSGIPEIKELAGLSEFSTVSEHEGIRLSNIYHFIMSHYARPLTLEEVAKQAFMTPQAFCRYFKKRTQHTFISFLNEVRVNEACKQLTDGNFDSIATIAYNCGFNSITNFNRVFKGVVGKAPSEYVETYYQNAS